MSSRKYSSGWSRAKLKHWITSYLRFFTHGDHELKKSSYAPYPQDLGKQDSSGRIPRYNYHHPTQERRQGRLEQLSLQLPPEYCKQDLRPYPKQSPTHPRRGHSPWVTVWLWALSKHNQQDALCPSTPGKVSRTTTATSNVPLWKPLTRSSPLRVLQCRPSLFGSDVRWTSLLQSARQQTAMFIWYLKKAFDKVLQCGPPLLGLNALWTSLPGSIWLQPSKFLYDLNIATMFNDTSSFKQHNR